MRNVAPYNAYIHTYIHRYIHGEQEYEVVSLTNRKVFIASFFRIEDPGFESHQGVRLFDI
jgi:hypothetical protein